MGKSVADALLERTVDELPPAEAFAGAGVYAIYYSGNYPLYQPIAERNRDGQFNAPIYIGKAVPAGARKGNVGLGTEPGPVLFSRLRQHGNSVEAVANLSLTDFACRFLVVEDIWIPLGESLLIQRFDPLWNLVIDGFGNHDPGSGRYNQSPSAWDILHPGRAWINRLTGVPRPIEEIEETISSFFLR